MAIFGDLERLIDDLYPYRWPIAILAVLAIALLLAVAYRRGWHLALWQHKLRTAIVIVPLLIVTIPLAYYLLSPLWTRTTIIEESPLAIASNNTVQGVPAATSTPVHPTPTAVVTATPTMDDVTPTMAAAPTASTTAVSPTEEPVIEPTQEPTPEPTLEPTPEPTPTVFMPRLVGSGPLSGADDFHFAEGTAQLIETAPGVYVLRLEEFSVRNGPDLFVYLTAGPDEIDDSAINLGALRATDGSINYDVPPGTDISQFQSVVIWCRAFSVLFGSAPLTAA